MIRLTQLVPVIWVRTRLLSKEPIWIIFRGVWVCIRIHVETLPKTVVPLGMWYPFQKHSTCTKYHYLHELTTRSSLASPIARNSFCASSYNLLIVTACFSDLGRMLKSNMQGLLTNPSPKVSSEWTSGMFGFPVTGSTTGWKSRPQINRESAMYKEASAT